jgi:type II secretory pathway pseudopilin PulG
MVEIAICLAIIGIALIAIIGVLPIGINVQKENRQETLIDQDAAVFLENLRNGARGLDDLTNYVLAITNFWTLYKDPLTTHGNGVNGYTYTAASVNGTPVPFLALTNGANIIGLLSTPEYTDANSGAPIPSLVFGGISNHVVAYVRSLSGPASEKPPQDNPIIIGDSFSYKIICDNAPVAVDTNLFNQYPPWQAQAYTGSPDAPVNVSYILNGQLTFWQTTNTTAAGNYPGESPLWVGIRPYGLELTANLRELRLTFLWPLLPNGNTGNGRHTFATTVAGQVGQIVIKGYSLYFFQPQSFTSAP